MVKERNKVSLVLGAILLAIIIPFSSMAADPVNNDTVNLALNGEFIAINYGGADSDLYPEDTHTIKEADAASIGRLNDGVIVSQSEYSEFESGWSDSLWNVEGSTRGRYVNFYRGDSRDIIMDLGQVSNITYLSMHAAAESSKGIAYPASMTYYASEDGVTYYKIGTVTEAEAADDTNVCTGVSPMTHKNYELTGLNYNARYIRVQFTVPIWVFADELEIYGYEEPSGSAEPLPEEEILIEEVPVNSYAATGQSGGTRQDYLAYQGWGTVSNKVVETYKTVDEYKLAIAYVDKEGTALDWLYDSVTVLGHGYTDRDGVYDIIFPGVTDAESYARKEDWQSWVDHVFSYTIEGSDEVYNMAALEEAVAEAKNDMIANGTLTQEQADAYKVKVKMSITPAIYLQNNWGIAEDDVSITLNSDGSISYILTKDNATDTLDFTLGGNAGDEETALSARASAYWWYITTIIETFEAQNYEHIVLDGFYYHEEVIRLTADLLSDKSIQIYNMLIEEAADQYNYGKLYSYWIPLYQAEGFKRWEEFGFDYAIMQPNYVFDKTATLTRIDSSAALSYKHGLGVEMEFGGIEKLEGFLTYLRKGETLQYQGSVQAWYWGTWSLGEIVNSSDYRYVYDMVYEYINGRSIYENLLESAELSVKVRQINNQERYDEIVDNLGKLTDGLVATGWSDSLQINNNNTSGPIEIIAQLGNTSSLGYLEMNFFEWAGAGVYMPSTVTYYISEDGINWMEIGTVTADDDYAMTISSGVSANYVKAWIPFYNDQETIKTWMGIDEFIVKGFQTSVGVKTPSVDTNKNLVTAEGLSLTADSQDVTASNGASLDVLADGVINGAWDSDNYFGVMTSTVEGPYTLTADLGEDCVVSGMSLNFHQWASAGVGPAEEVVFYTSLDGSSWTKAGTAIAVSSYITEYTEPVGVDYILSLNSSMAARYIKAVFSGTKDLYEQNDKVYGWIALNEFVVEGTTVSDPNVPLPLEGETILTSDMLTITINNKTAAGVVAEKAANEAISVLADGIYGGKWPFVYNNAASSPYIGFEHSMDIDNSGYTLIADLGNLYDITGISLDFYHDTNASGLYRPDEVVYSISEDGESWTVVSVTTSPIISDISGAAGHYKAEYVFHASDITARYVRAEFSRAIKSKTEGSTSYWSWIGLDEFVVTGTKAASAAVTVSAENGTASVSASEVVPGGSVVLTFAPDADYELLDVLINGVNIGKVSSPYEITDIQEDIEIHVIFTEIDGGGEDEMAAVTVSAENGTASVSASEVVLGGSVVLTFAPDADYKLSDILINGISIGRFGSPYRITDIQEDIEIRVIFIEIDSDGEDEMAAVTVSAENGIASVSASEVVSGGSVELTFAPDADYELSDVLINGVSIGKVSSPYEITDIQGNIEIRVIFTEIGGGGEDEMAAVTVSAENGTASVSASEVVLGGSVELTFAPDADYELSDILINGVSIGKVSSPYEITDIQEDIEIHVIFTEIAGGGEDEMAAVTVSAENGTASVSASEVVLGGSVELTFAPDADYELSDVLINSASIGKVNSPYEITDIQENIEIRVIFTEIAGGGEDEMAAVTVSAKNGTASVSASKVVLGGSVSLTFAPDAGYELSDVLINGASIGKVNSPYEITDIQENIEIRVIFTEIAGGGEDEMAAVTVSAKNGTASVSASKVVLGGNVSLTFAPDAGYELSDVLINGVSIGKVNSPYEITDIQDNIEIRVIFTEIDGAGKDNMAAVTVSAEKGTASVSASKVVLGGSVSLTFKPNAGYELSDVLINGVSIGKVDSPYKIINIQQDLEIKVIFTKVISEQNKTSQGKTPVNPGKSTEAVSTGDNSFGIVWIIIMFASLAAIVIVYVKKRKIFR